MNIILRRKTMKGLRAVIIAALLSLFAIGVMAQVSTPEDVPRISKEKLKAMLGKPDVTILDVRLEAQWQADAEKIPGAVHENPALDVKSWLDKYPKDKTIVLY
jgi:cytochrome c-type biogenesis protein CcmH/NrfG